MREIVLIVGLALPITVVGCTPHDGGGTALVPEASCQRPWMRTWARDEGMQLRACETLELDDDETPEAVAQACSADGYRAVYLIDDDTDRWAVGHDGWGHVPICPADVLVAGATSFPLDDVGPGEHERRSVALVHGHPDVVDHVYTAARRADGSRVAVPAIGAELSIQRIGAISRVP